jgi:CxxC-x17-CxxC domain-containing protein
MKPFKKFSGRSDRDSGRDRPDRRDSPSRDSRPSRDAGGRSDFRSRDSRDSPRPYSDRPSERSFGPKKTSNGFELFTAICDKCGKECDLPFKPTGGKPVYCRSCFRDGDDSRPSDKIKINTPYTVSTQDIDRINRKLDRIMKALKIE